MPSLVSRETIASPHSDAASPTGRTLILIGLISFLTLVDLFAAQAILPTLVRVYRTTPAMMGFAVNASTIGMAIAGVAIALLSRKFDRRTGIWLSLALLALPTSLLATAHGLGWFTALRITQGLCMSTAFTLTMAYLAEQSSAQDAASALAAYVTGNVMSNLFGRVLSAAITDHVGLNVNFYAFAALNLAGAALVYFGLERAPPMRVMTLTMGGSVAVWRAHLANAGLRASFAIGSLILFAFIGTFTYVNFVLARPPIALSPMSLGLVYLVFAPSVLTTPLAGLVVHKLGTRASFVAALLIAIAGLPLLLAHEVTPILVGLALVGAGTFFAQAVVTGFVGRAAQSDRASASGIYLACYYLGGIAGSAVLGLVFENFGWTAAVSAIAVSLVLASVIGLSLRPAQAPSREATLAS